MGYLGECVHRAFRGSVLFTDKVSIVGGVLAPALFYAWGRPMDAAYQGYVAWTILTIVGVGILLRLVTAPYFIWRDDKQEIKRLAGIVADTSRRRREYFEEKFLDDRAQLARDITHYAMVVAPAQSFASFDADVHLNALMPKAAILLGNTDFRIYWETFCLAFRNMIRGAQFIAANAGKMPNEHAKLAQDRFDYDMGAMKAGATALIFLLTENADHEKLYLDLMNGLNDQFAHCRSDNVAANVWTLPPSQLPPDTGEETPR